MITVTAYSWVPPIVRGLVRDLRVRWALEEAGLPYRVQLIDLQDKPADYREWQPWSQVPAYEEDGLRLFESGAIVLHIAEKSPALAPEDVRAKAAMTCWLFAAINSVEPPLQELVLIDFMHADKAWAKVRRPEVEAFVQRRFKGLADSLAGRDYLEGGFTAADLMMASVLRMARNTDLVDEAGLGDYLARCEARPAFQKALAAQMADFKDAA
ncbi:MAG TPA: glutathione S-transferase family protein [Caulobacteraceae bacterium]